MRYYVSSAGNDSNDGSYSSPWLTIGKVNTEDAASTFAAGDSILFKGGETFDDAGLSLNNATGTAAAPITVTSYDGGRATISTASGAVTPITLGLTCAYVNVIDMDLVCPTGAATGVGRGFTFNGCSDCLARNCTTFGGEHGFYVDGGNRLEDCISRWAWNVGFYFSDSSNTFYGIEALGAGYGEDHTPKNGTTGAGIRTITSGTTTGEVVKLIQCATGLDVGASTTATINRLYTKVDRDDQEEAVIAGGTATNLYNSIIVYDARISTDGGAGTYYMVDNAADLTMINCTMFSLVENTEDTGTALLMIRTSATTVIRNTTITAALTRLIYAETAIGSYTGNNNNYISAAPSSAMYDADALAPGPALTVSEWVAERASAGDIELGTISFDPTFTNVSLVAGPAFARSANDDRLGEVPEDTAVFLQGADYIVAPLLAAGFSVTDYYGNPRLTELTRVTIGAHEPVVYTYQDFGIPGGDPQWNITSPEELPSYAALLQVPDTTQGYSFYVESNLFGVNLALPGGSTNRIGIWAMGSRLAAGSAPVAISTKDVWTAPASADLPSGDFSDYPAIWQIGPKELEDTRRIILAFEADTGCLRLYSEDPTLQLDRNYALSPAERTSDDHTIRIGFDYKGRTPGGAFGFYIYDLTAYLDGRPVISRPGLQIPAAWVEGTGYTLGRAHYAGIIGASLMSPSQFGWNDLVGRVTSALQSSLPVGSTGEARPKDIMADRGQAPNLLTNGGFTRYPRTQRITKREGVVRQIDPNWQNPGVTDSIGVHVGFVVDLSNSVSGVVTQVRRTIVECINNMAQDGSELITVIGHNSTAFTVVPPTVLDSSTVAGVISSVNAMLTASGERWDLAWNAIATAMATPVAVGPNLETGYNKIIFNVTDYAQLGTNTTAYTSAIAAMHALPGLQEVSLLIIEATVDQVYNRGLWPQVYYPQGIPVNSPLAGNPWASAVAVPNTTGAVAISAVGDSTSTILPSTNTGVAPPASYDELGQNAATQIAKWLANWNNLLNQQIPVTPPYVYGDAFQSLPDRNPGFSFNVPSTRPSEGDLGGWLAWGGSSILEVQPPEVMPSPDGGNVLKLVLGAAGTVTLAQPLTDLRPLAGQSLSMAFSASAGVGRVKVEMVAVINGTEQVLGTFYSRSFGLSSRIVRSLTLPIDLQSLELQLRFSGPVDTSMCVSGIQASLGDYAPHLPFSESPQESIIPPGTVIMVTGDSCPVGYRQLPDSEGRIPYGFLGDPNFYERGLPPSSSATQPSVYDSELDLVVLVDGSSDQGPYVTEIHTWLTELILNKLPEDGSVRVSLIFTNKPFPALVMTQLTPVNATTKTNIFKPEIDKINNPNVTPTFGQNDRILAGIIQAKQILDAGNGRRRMMVWNDSHTYGFTSVVTNALNDLYALPRFVESSAVAIGSTSSQVRAVHGETHAYPQPSTSAPGIIFTWTGGTPGHAVAGQYSGQPFQAGQYIAEVFWRRIEGYLPVTTTAVLPRDVDGLEPNNLGGHLEHDHANGEQFGSSLNEPDGFEPCSDTDAETASSLPIRDTAQIRVYPFGMFPNLTRPEDPPTLAIGPNHRHTVNTKMAAQPPGFNIRFCVKD